MAESIYTMTLVDGTEFDVSALKYVSTTSSGNVQMVSPEGTKMNFEAGDNEAHKPMGKLQLDTNHYADADDKNKFRVAVICDKKNKVEGMNIECAGIDFETYAADTANWTANQFRMRFRGNNSTDTWADVNMHFRSLDLRARALGCGTGGGIAMQTASCDSNLHENKLKHETDRIVDIEQGLPTTEAQWGTFYNGTGGKGLELDTNNSQFDSRYHMEYRFKRLGKIYAVTRQAPVEVDGKTDYPTQADDSKDIKGETSITFDELVRGIRYLIDNNLIQSSEALGLTTDIVE